MLNPAIEASVPLSGLNHAKPDTSEQRRKSVPAAVPISRQALLDLGQRAQLDYLYFLIANVGIAIFEPVVVRRWFFVLYTAINLICTASTVLYLQRWQLEVAASPRRAQLTFTLLKCCQNLCLSCEIGWIVVVFGVNPVTAMGTPMVIAFAHSTLISMRPNATVLRSTVTCCLAPIILASLSIGGRPGFGTALILCLDLIYLWFHGNRENIHYLRSVHQTQELRRDRRKATQEGARISDALLSNAARHTATVAERNRIAYEWHDTLLAGFSAISWQLDEARLRQHEDPVHAGEAIELARKMLNHYRVEARLVIADLLYEEADAKNLVTLIDQDIRKLVPNDEICFQLKSTGKSILLPPDITSQLLRICQEAVTNSLRHANPSLIRIDLEFRAGEIRISIADNGSGFLQNANKSSHFGLEIMKQRARRLGGELCVKSILDHGSVVLVNVPYSANFTMAPTRILVIEDQYFSRLALHTVLDSHPDMKIAFEADTGLAGIAAFREQPA